MRPASHRSFGVFSLLLLLLLCSCAQKPAFLKKPYQSPSLLAILPMNNITNDLSGPDVVRTVLQQGLSRKGYRTIPIDVTDEKLREAGITDGGQLTYLTPREVGKLLEVDGLLYGELRDFRLVNLGFYISRQVEADFRLVEVETEELIWQDDKKFATRQFTVDPAEAVREFSKEAGKKVLENIFKSPLLEETRVVVGMILQTLPNHK
jgi:hypothetical protein